MCRRMMGKEEFWKTTYQTKTKKDLPRPPHPPTQKKTKGKKGHNETWIEHGHFSIISNPKIENTACIPSFSPVKKQTVLSVLFFFMSGWRLAVCGDPIFIAWQSARRVWEADGEYSWAGVWTDTMSSGHCRVSLRGQGQWNVPLCSGVKFVDKQEIKALIGACFLFTCYSKHVFPGVFWNCEMKFTASTPKKDENMQKVKKTTTLFNKTKYCCHDRNVEGICAKHLHIV